jgi:hypothetical protein
VLAVSLPVTSSPRVRSGCERDLLTDNYRLPTTAFPCLRDVRLGYPQRLAWVMSVSSAEQRTSAKGRYTEVRASPWLVPIRAKNGPSSAFMAGTIVIEVQGGRRVRVLGASEWIGFPSQPPTTLRPADWDCQDDSAIARPLTASVGDDLFNALVRTRISCI